MVYKFEKYQRAILGLRIPNSVSILEKKKKMERHFAEFFFKPKKWNFDQNKINLGEQTEEVALVWESILKLLLCIC